MHGSVWIANVRSGKIDAVRRRKVIVEGACVIVGGLILLEVLHDACDMDGGVIVLPGTQAHVAFMASLGICSTRWEYRLAVQGHAYSLVGVDAATGGGSDD